MKSKSRKDRDRRLIRTVSICILLLFVMSVPVFADTKSILNQFGFESNSPVQNVLRSFGWSFVTGLHWLVKGLEDVIYNINGALGGFFTSANVVAIENKILPVAVALIGVLILFIGIVSMFKPQQFTTITSNFIIGVAVAIALPALLSAGYNFADQTIAYINSDASGKMQKLSDHVLTDNVTDMTRYDADGFRTVNIKYKSYYATPGAPSEKITSINPTETVDPENTKKKDVWKNRIVTDRNGKQTLQELNSGKVGFVDVPILSEYYYRWKINWLNIISTLLITGVALILSSIKIARLLYELAIHQVATQVIALLDVMTAQRLRKCIQMLLATFATLIGIFFLLQMYLIGMEYIQNVTPIPLKLILMIALAWSVVDGPNLFEQLFGVDAGLHGAMQSIYGLKAAGGAMVGGAALLGGRGLIEKVKAGGVLGSALKVGGTLGGGAAGGAAGLAAGRFDVHRRVQAVRAAAEKTQNPSAAAGPAAKAAAGGVEGAGVAEAVKNVGAAAVGSAVVAGAVKSVAGGGGPKAATTGTTNATKEKEHTPLREAVKAAESVTAEQSSVQSARPAREPVNQPEGEVNNVGQAAEKAPVGQTAERRGHSRSAPETVGGFLKQKVQSGSSASSARRVYSLNRGSMQKHGDKLVAREERIQQLQRKAPDLSRHDAKKQAKHELRKERKDERKQNNPTFAEQELKEEQKKDGE
ncbi:conserved membrane protein of unknown function [Ruminococcaceae bacterium BL-6]|nr:conserved membrane protein of unknown function [Ruminococcaceae bacterium BL-6]